MIRRGGGCHQPLFVLWRAQWATHHTLRSARGLTLAVLMLVGVGTASAQSSPPGPTVPKAEYLEQRVRDLRDYRDYLEDQVAAAKALAADYKKRLDRADAALQACQRPPTQEPTTP